MSARASSRRASSHRAPAEDPEDGAESARPRLALGLLATLPLLLVYEAALASVGGERRNTAEVLLSLPLAPLGDLEGVARLALLLAVGVLALVLTLRVEPRPAGALLRIGMEGFLAALCLGPLLLLAHGWIAADLPAVQVPDGPRGERLGLDEAGLLLGAGGWEELAFRFLAYSLFFLLARHVASFLGLSLFWARVAGDVAGVLGSAALFAAFHLGSFTAWLGPGGEPYDGALFAWRFLAGLLLGLLFRWRGLGVAAWAHGLFNVALALGAGPGVFLGRGA